MLGMPNVLNVDEYKHIMKERMQTSNSVYQKQCTDYMKLEADRYQTQIVRPQAEVWQLGQDVANRGHALALLKASSATSSDHGGAQVPGPASRVGPTIHNAASSDEEVMPPAAFDPIQCCWREQKCS